MRTRALRAVVAAVVAASVMAPSSAFADHTARFQGESAIGTGAIILTVVGFALGIAAVGGFGFWLARRDKREEGDGAPGRRPAPPEAKP